MQFNGRLEIKPTDIILKEECRTWVGTNTLTANVSADGSIYAISSGHLGKVGYTWHKIGSGEINQIALMQNYQYYGKANGIGHNR